ncbi:hypothetical protein [Streptomyces sp. NPDC097981]|uniref:hypothetical protein n=1 Tax=Streptomyces sp. NPDC097981 TaxID=3155428 RepID=UPI003317130F
MPDDLCGVRVGADLLRPVLAPGKQLKVESSDHAPDAPRCQAVVDHRRVLYVRGDVVSLDEDPIQSTREELERWGHPEKIAVGDDGRVADGTVIAFTSCTYHGEKRRFAAQANMEGKLKDDMSATREALTRFMAAYLPAASKAVGCPR